jgi:hypothetical protein
MTHLTARMAAKTAQKTEKTAASANDGLALDRRYGGIGISAVAAAVRYQGAAKNTAYAPVAHRQDDRIEDAA